MAKYHKLQPGDYLKPVNVFVGSAIAESFAASKLSATAFRVLLLFYKRRKMKKVGPTGRSTYAVDNNGQLVFTYGEAEQRYGISESTFKNALKRLVETGFLSISEHGTGVLGGRPNKFRLDDRWLKYGTPDFIEVKWDKRSVGVGFSAANQPTRKGIEKAKAQSKVTVTDTSKSSGGCKPEELKPQSEVTATETFDNTWCSEPEDIIAQSKTTMEEALNNSGVAEPEELKAQSIATEEKILNDTWLMGGEELKAYLKLSIADQLEYTSPEKPKDIKVLPKLTANIKAKTTVQNRGASPTTPKDSEEEQLSFC